MSFPRRSNTPSLKPPTPKPYTPIIQRSAHLPPFLMPSQVTPYCKPTGATVIRHTQDQSAIFKKLHEKYAEELAALDAQNAAQTKAQSDDAEVIVRSNQGPQA